MSLSNIARTPIMPSPMPGPGESASLHEHQSLGRPVNAKADEPVSDGLPIGDPAAILGDKTVAVGFVPVRAKGLSQAHTTSATFTRFFKNLGSQLLNGLRSTWQRVAGETERAGGASRAERSDARFRVTHDPVIQYLEKSETGLAANTTLMDALYANGQSQKSPLTRGEIKAYVAAGEKLISALQADPQNKAGLVRLEVEGHPVAFESSQYASRAIAYAIAAQVSSKDIASGSATAMSSLNSGGAVVFKDPGNRIGKFLASAPAAVKREPSYFSPREALLSSYRHEPKFDGSGKRIAPPPEVAGSIDDARKLMPGAGGAMVFDRVSGDRAINRKTGQEEETEALCMRFTPSESHTFEDTNEAGIADRASTLSNIGQGLERLFMPSLSTRGTKGATRGATQVINAASAQSRALHTRIGAPFHQLMMAADEAGFLADTSFRSRVSEHANAIIDEGFDSISEAVFDLIHLAAQQQGWPGQKALLESAHHLADEIAERRTHFGDAPAHGLRRHGAEIHIAFTEHR